MQHGTFLRGGFFVISSQKPSKRIERKRFILYNGSKDRMEAFYAARKIHYGY